MTEVGISELLLIMVVALIVVGPERLPGLARKAGYWVGRLRHYVAGVRSEIEEQLQADELRQMMQRQEQEMAELRDLLHKSRGEVEGSLEEVNDYLVRAAESGDSTPKEGTPDTDNRGDEAEQATATREALPQGFEPAPAETPEPVKQPVGNEQKTRH
ncbi:MAG: twin-arginine translocase subunit TatB [Gammaproteobacteria bacterium]|nr:MAG: twin-arginine translocase subunit TatB [Gammaproteobacteria bacterium]